MQKELKIILLVIVSISTAVVTASGQTKSKQEKYGKDKVPDVQIIDVQYLEPRNSKAPDEIHPATLHLNIRNNTRDRTLVGLLLKIEVYNGASLVEEIRPYLRMDAYKPGSSMVIPAGKTMTVAFDVVRTVRVPHYEVRPAILSYVYRDFDFGRDKPSYIEKYATQDWPFGDKLEPMRDPGK
jgi:hypothetical protein